MYACESLWKMRQSLVQWILDVLRLNTCIECGGGTVALEEIEAAMREIMA